MNLNQIWQSTLSELELQISRPNFLTWLKNSELMGKDDQGIVIVGLPNNFAKEWVQNKYHKMILGSLRQIDDTVRRIEYVVIDTKKPGLQPSARVSAPAQSQNIFPELKIDPETNLNPKYTLGSFVVGSSNELSYAA